MRQKVSVTPGEGALQVFTAPLTTSHPCEEKCLGVYMQADPFCGYSGAWVSIPKNVCAWKVI